MQDYKLSRHEIDGLDEKTKSEYLRAIGLCECENAGGPGGGWADGFEMLEKLGWVRSERLDGHRTFVSWTKPAKVIAV